MSHQHLNSQDRPGILVLKLGGSVLRDEADTLKAVHEIYRWVRRGERVIAVVSALEGTTDALIARARSCADAPDSPDALHPGAYAALLATGEETSAALLALALDRAGVPVELLDAAAVSLQTSGTTIDAFPESIDAARIVRTLEQVPVVVMPGFVGRDELGRTTLLGRGGSDLTALFVAAQVRDAMTRSTGGRNHGTNASHVRCLLVKDIDGLYEFDPALAQSGDGCGSPAPSRYATIHWDDALTLDGGIVQHKAVRYAREHALEFCVGAAFSREATLVGDVHTRLESRLADDQESAVHVRSRERARVLLLGCGTVGLGVYQRLVALRDQFELTGVVVRDIDKARRAGVERTLLSSDIEAATVRPHDLVIETIGGIEPARGAIERALRDGKHVITANKAVIAAAGAELQTLAVVHGGSLRYAASVGGGLPAIESVERFSRVRGVEEIRGVLNGTTNFVLGLVETGVSLDDAILLAQRAGFAEADPSRDLDGRDAADKLCVLAREAWGVTLNPEEIERKPLTTDALTAARTSLQPGQVLRHVARLWRTGEESTGVECVRGEVTLQRVACDGPLGRVEREWNALVIRSVGGVEEVVIGRGAGRWPTTESVIADVLEAAAMSRCRATVTR